MKDEHYQQVATEGCAGCVGGGQGCTARLRPSLQPPPLHSAATVRMYCLEDFLQDRLSRHYGYAGRPERSSPHHRSATCSALYHTPKSRETTADFYASQPAARCDDSSCYEKIFTCASGCNRFLRPGKPPYQPILRAKAFPRARPLADNDIRSFPKTRCGLRLRPSSDPLDTADAWSYAGCQSIATNSHSSAQPCSDCSVDGRCGIRFRSQPRFRSRAMWHRDDHSSQARTSDHTPANRLLPTHDGLPLRQESLWTAMAGRDGLQHDQTQSWFSPARANLLVTVPRHDAPGTCTQYHYPETNEAFLQSRSGAFNFLSSSSAYWRTPPRTNCTPPSGRTSPARRRAV